MHVSLGTCCTLTSGLVCMEETMVWERAAFHGREVESSSRHLAIVAAPAKSDLRNMSGD